MKPDTSRTSRASLQSISKSPMSGVSRRTDLNSKFFLVGTKNKLEERDYVLNRSKQVQVEQVANGLLKIQPL